MYDDQLLLSTLSGFVRRLVQPYDADTALHDLTERVTSVLDLMGSGVSLVSGDRLTYVTVVPEKVAVLEQAQEESQLGPCVTAYRSGETVTVSDLRLRATEWVTYCAVAKEVGVNAVAGIPMHLGDTIYGALNLYAAEVREWQAEDLAVAKIMADMATGYLSNASELGQQQQINEQLRIALDSRVIIEQAKGMISVTHTISVDQAFELLRRHARSRNASIHAVAEAVVNLGLTL